MLEDCICSMHRYSFSSSAGVHVISAGAAVDDYCPTSREDCPTKQLPDDARRARRRSGDGDRRSSTTTQRCSTSTCLLSFGIADQRCVPGFVTGILLCGGILRLSGSPSGSFNGMHPVYGGSAARRQRLAMARPDEDEFGRVRRGGQSSPSLGGLSVRRAPGGQGDPRLERRWLRRRS